MPRWRRRSTPPGSPLWCNGSPGVPTPCSGRGGAGLSAGERQRVALARAFLRDAPILLLDEPTAGLDNATEADVLTTVARLGAGRTVLLVAHRPALAALADRVIQMPRATVAAWRRVRPVSPGRSASPGRLGDAWPRRLCSAPAPSVPPSP